MEGGERDSLSSSIPEMQYFDNSDNNFDASQIIAGRCNESRQLSYFGRINADYADKYLVTFNIRATGYITLPRINVSVISPPYHWDGSFRKKPL
jgi:hypothetical protein